MLFRSEIPENATLRDVIGLVGGIKNKKQFKAAQFGLPFGGFLTLKDLDKKIDDTLFIEGVEKNIIILSEEDCVVTFAKFYIEFLIGKAKEGRYKKYEKVLYELERIWRILDRITKGKATMRDLYLLRYLSEQIKTMFKQRFNLVYEVIENFYEEIEDHIENHKCPAGECVHLLKFRITDKCIGCTACARVCPVKCIDGKLKEKHEIDNDRCTHCGQCVVACPVGAIFEGDNTLSLLRDLATPNKLVVVQVAPARKSSLLLRTHVIRWEPLGQCGIIFPTSRSVHLIMLLQSSFC